MPLILNCPTCSRKLRVPDELFGTRVQCPSCSTAFDAAASPPPLPTEPTPLPASESPAASPVSEVPSKLSLDDGAPQRLPQRKPPLELRGDDRERDEDDDDDRPWEQSRRRVRRDCEPHRGGVVLALGILSIVLSTPIGLGLGIAAWIMGQRDLRKMRQGIMDPFGQGTTQAGWICGIIGTILSSLTTLFCFAYVVFIMFFINAMSQMPTKKMMTPTQQPKQPPPIKKMQIEGVPLRALDYLPRR